MAIHANSTPAPKRTLLREAAAPGRLLPALSLHHDRSAELLAILDAGPLPHALMPGRRRRAIQAGIDALIDYLDATTPDPDLEPTLGANEPGGTATTHWMQHSPGLDLEVIDEDGDDLDRGEAEHDGREPDADGEPSLGAPEPDMPYYRPACAAQTRIGDQRFWSGGSDDDRERDDDMEPTLGQPEGIYHNQTHWGRIGGTAYEDEECLRRHPGYGEGMAIIAEQDRMARAA